MATANEQLTIDAEWLAGGDAEPPEIAATAASIFISAGDHVATAIDNRWSMSTSNRAPLSAYPLAQWIAASWWRLRWESGLLGMKESTSWRMAHEVAAANHGFLWPQLRIECDGSFVEFICRPTRLSEAEPIRYLGDFQVRRPAIEWERAAERFVEFVLRRLDDRKLPDTELHRLWAEVQTERRDPAIAKWRRFEAAAGFDPDDLEESVFRSASTLEQKAGPRAAEEIAACCQGEAPPRIIARFEQLAERAGIAARFPRIERIPARFSDTTKEPWERGRSLAEHARRTLGLEEGPVSDSRLADLTGLTARALRGDGSDASGHVAGLAVRKKKTDGHRVVFRRGNSSARRFEIARMLGDSLLASEQENWLPCTDGKTARQRQQRAFAVEFLCPVREIEDHLGDDYSPTSIERLADRYRISPLAVTSHLVNHGRIAPERLSAFTTG